jgi:hypothetical protein
MMLLIFSTKQQVRRGVPNSIPAITVILKERSLRLKDLF